MSILVRILLVAGGALAAIFLSRDAPNFPIAQALFGILVACAVLGAFLLVANYRRSAAEHLAQGTDRERDRAQDS